MVMKMNIYTERLTIKEISYNDAKAYYEYARDVTTATLAGFKPVDDLETANRLVTGMMYQGDTYSIFLKEKNIFIGTCNLYKKSIRQLKDVYTLGISLNKKYWGCGFGPEALRGLINYAFNYKGAKIIEIVSEVNNIRSRKMIEKLDFNLDGIIKRYGKLYNGQIYDIALYSLFLEDYKEKKVWAKY